MNIHKLTKKKCFWMIPPNWLPFNKIFVIIKKTDSLVSVKYIYIYIYSNARKYQQVYFPM